MESVFLAPRVLDDGVLKRKTILTAFGIAGASVSVKAGRLYKLRLSNTAAATKYFVQIFDKATAPVATDIPIWEGQVNAVSDFTEDFGMYGLYVTLGIGIAISSTPATLTLAAANDAVAAFAMYTQVT